MKTLLLCLLLSVVLASAVPCSSDSDCLSPLTCRDNRCVFSRPFAPESGNSNIVRFPSNLPKCPYDVGTYPNCLIRIHRDFEPNGMKCGNTYCTTGFGCINGRCKFNGNKFHFSHFLFTPCPVPCEEFGKVCVRGVCQ